MDVEIISINFDISGRGPAEDDRGPDEDRSGEAEAEEEGGQEGEV